MDQELYDEFGNYIGPDIEDDDHSDGEVNYTLGKLNVKDLEEARHAFAEMNRDEAPSKVRDND